MNTCLKQETFNMKGQKSNLTEGHGPKVNDALQYIQLHYLFKNV